jgi:hypothetical protein
MQHINNEEKNTAVLSIHLSVRTATNPKRERNEKTDHHISETMNEFNTILCENVKACDRTERRLKRDPASRRQKQE